MIFQNSRKIFPPGPNRVWVAVNESGDFYCPDAEFSFSPTKAVKTYTWSDEKLPNVHNYKPFLEYMNETTPFHYRDWKSVTRKYLTDNNIPRTLEKKSFKKQTFKNYHQEKDEDSSRRTRTTTLYVFTKLCDDNSSCQLFLLM